MNKLAIIGGSGLTTLDGLKITNQKDYDTPYGKPSSALVFGEYAGKEIIFLTRHGNPHVIPPHMVNYRANIWALKDNDIDNIVGINAVGGITSEMYPERIVIPDQIIDYTWSRKHTFYEEGMDHVTHIDFTYPYSKNLRKIIINAAEEAKIDIIAGGTYGATQGPRLESTAEITRMQQDGCDIVGMTGMPETALAKELSIEYASISLVVNWAAGKSDGIISMEIIENHLKAGMNQIIMLISKLIGMD